MISALASDSMVKWVLLEYRLATSWFKYSLRTIGGRKPVYNKFITHTLWEFAT